jgi:hypothetical protein
MHLTILTTSDSAKVKGKIAKSKYTISYSLPAQLNFTEPHVARLIDVVGSFKSSLYVEADFVQGSFQNGNYKPFLGFKNTTSIKPWVPILNTLPREGLIALTAISGGTLEKNPFVCVVFEIAPASSIYGATNATEL